MLHVAPHHSNGGELPALPPTGAQCLLCKAEAAGPDRSTLSRAAAAAPSRLIIRMLVLPRIGPVVGSRRRRIFVHREGEV
jgi:hypothetical protein